MARIHQQSRTSRTVLYCSYLGGVGRDRALVLALDALGGAIVAGSTDSTNPTNWPVTPGGRLGEGGRRIVDPAAAPREPAARLRHAVDAPCRQRQRPSLPRHPAPQPAAPGS